MAIQVTSQPITDPTGVRFTTGKINWNGATYTVNGDSISVAQWGGGVNGIPNRFPDFVFFAVGGSNASDTPPTSAAGFGTVARYIPGTGKVQLYGEEALLADSGLTEMDAEACVVEIQFVALWVTYVADPAVN